MTNTPQQRKGHPRRPLSFLLPFLLTALLTPLTVAQRATPSSNAFFTTLQDKAFYVAGGFFHNNYLQQFYILDLTVPQWDTSSPPWFLMPDLPKALTPRTSLQGGIIHNGEDLFLSAGGNASATFNFKTKVWSPVTLLPPALFTGSSEAQAAVDPKSGKVIIPSICLTEGANPLGTMIYLPDTKVAKCAPGVEVASAGGVVVHPRVLEYSIVWSDQRGTALLYGGYTGEGIPYNANLLEFSVETAKWSILKTTGPSPGDLSSACMVSAYNGTKIVLFGGSTSAKNATNLVHQTSASIHILDLTTLTWTKGTDIASNLKRTQHVCTSAGDNFVAFGGDPSDDFVEVNGGAFPVPVIYNLKMSQWTEQFQLANAPGQPPPTIPAPPEPGKQNSGESSTSSSSSTGAIAGGVVAGLVVIFAAVGFLIYRRRRRRQNQQQPQNYEDDAAKKRISSILQSGGSLPGPHAGEKGAAADTPRNLRASSTDPGSILADATGSPQGLHHQRHPQLPKGPNPQMYPTPQSSHGYHPNSPGPEQDQRGGAFPWPTPPPVIPPRPKGTNTPMAWSLTPAFLDDPLKKEQDLAKAQEMERISKAIEAEQAEMERLKLEMEMQAQQQLLERVEALKRTQLGLNDRNVGSGVAVVKGSDKNDHEQ